jgi:hypothetical protein
MVLKTMRMRWEKYTSIISMEAMKNAYKMLVRKPLGKGPVGGL